MKCGLDLVVLAFSHFTMSTQLTVLKGKANSCVCFLFEKSRKSVLTLLSACDPQFIGLTQSLKKMSAKTNQKTKEMDPHLNKDNIIIVAG